MIKRRNELKSDICAIACQYENSDKHAWNARKIEDENEELKERIKKLNWDK